MSDTDRPLYGGYLLLLAVATAVILLSAATDGSSAYGPTALAVLLG